MSNSISQARQASAWDSLNRDDLHQDVKSLEREARQKNLSSARTEPCLVTHAPNAAPAILPETERRLYKNFAWVAAWQKDLDCISVASVSQMRDSGAFCVCLAANGGISKEVQAQLTKLFGLLRACASNSEFESLIKGSC